MCVLHESPCFWLYGDGVIKRQGDSDGVIVMGDKVIEEYGESDRYRNTECTC